MRRLEQLGRALGLTELWLKDDGVSSAIYGGNKVRKLELLLARAIDRGRSGVTTFGALGSHHALATALFAREAGLRADLYLYPQPLNHHVLDNLLLDQHSGARLIRVAHLGLLPFKVSLGALRRGAHRGEEELIPPGGSDPLGALGYVDAALELAAQVKAGALPEPDAIVLAAGTCGTAAGLAVGLELTDLATRVLAVQVVESAVCNRFVLNGLARLTARRLRRHGATIVDRAPPRLELIKGQLGRGYGHPTEAAAEALERLEELEGLRLEPTYTAKALAGLIALVKDGRLCGQRVLFWNTVSTVDRSAELASVSPLDLPKAFHADFAALDRLPEAS